MKSVLHSAWSAVAFFLLALSFPGLLVVELGIALTVPFVWLGMAAQDKADKYDEFARD